MAVPYFRFLFADIPPRKPPYSPRLSFLGFVVDKVALIQDSMQVLQFLQSLSFHEFFTHTVCHSSPTLPNWQRHQVRYFSSWVHKSWMKIIFIMASNICGYSEWKLLHVTFRKLEYWCGSLIFGKFVHLCVLSHEMELHFGHVDTYVFYHCDFFTIFEAVFLPVRTWCAGYCFGLAVRSRYATGVSSCLFFRCTYLSFHSRCSRRTDCTTNRRNKALPCFAPPSPCTW